MSWDWKKAGPIEQPPAEATGAKPAARARKHSRAGKASGEDAPLVRHAAGIALRSAGARAAGLPTELLYGDEHDCAFCGGEGQTARAGQCPICHGSGKVQVHPPVVRCAFCHGKGKKTASSTVTCLVCRGTGIVAVTPPVEICPECKGRGKKRGQSLYCGRCRGAGVVTSPGPAGAGASAGGTNTETFSSGGRSDS